MSKYIVANANTVFIKKIGITEEEVQNYLISGLNEDSFENLDVLEDDFIGSQIQTEIERMINDAVEDEIAESLAEAIEAKLLQ